jgi:hypothetical protein
LATFLALAGGGGGFLELRPELGAALPRPAGGALLRPAGGALTRAAGGALVRAAGGALVRAAGGALVRAGGRIDDLVVAEDAFAEALPFAAVFDLFLRPVRSSFSAMYSTPRYKRGQ